MMLELAEQALGSRLKLEARTAILSAGALTLAIYASSFHPAISLSIIFLAILYGNFNRILKAVFVSLPFLFLFALSSLFLSGSIVLASKMLLAIIAMIAVGSGILYGIQPEEFTNALLFFHIPYRYAFSISLAFRMLQIFLRDARCATEALRLSGEKGLGYHKRLLKTLASIAVLRSIGISETLYSRGFNPSNRVECRVRRPSKSDYALLAISAMLLCIA
jgi:hypothetical protein